MAKKIELDLDLRLKAVEDELKKVNDGVQDIGESAKKSTKATEGLADGFTMVGLSIKAMGVGLILKAFEFLWEAMQKNQVVMDALSVGMEAFGFIFQTITNYVIDFGTQIFDAFSNPKQAIADLWDAIKTNIVNRFEGFIDQWSALGKVIEGVFSLDWDKVKEGASDYGTALIQMGTGLDEEQQQAFADGVKNVGKQLIETTKAGIDYGKQITKMRNEVKLAEANQRQMMLQYQKEAEIQRQIRDDVSLTIEERQEANTKLGEILDEQFEEEKKLMEKRIELAQMESDANKGNVDLQVELINAKTELVDLEERITGQRSEQLVNEVGLIQEGIDKKNEDIEKDREVAEAKKSHLEGIAQLTSDYFMNEEERIIAQREKETEDLLQHFIDLEALYEGNAGKIEEITRLKNAKLEELQDKHAEIDAQKQQAQQLSNLGAVAGFMGQAKGLMEEGSAGYKAMAIGEATISTYLAVQKAMSELPIPLNYIASGLALVTGLKNVAEIKKTKVGDNDTGGDTPPPSPDIPSGSQFDKENAITSSFGQNLMIGGDEQAPIKAYVVTNEVSSSQEAREKVEQQATL